MKKERRGIIAITDNGIVTVPNNERMSIGEIADLFGIYYKEAKRYIRAIEKSGIAEGDYTMSCIADGLKVYPDYYGLDMVIVLAFKVQSIKAEVFRGWLLKQIDTNHLHAQILVYSKNISRN